MPCRVLMFGWEFPPQFNGGLGIACYGLTKAMSTMGALDVTLVLPKTMPVTKTVERFVFADQHNDVSGSVVIHAIDSLLSPYMSDDIYNHRRVQTDNHETCPTTYGATIFDEVYRYGVEAGRLVSQQIAGVDKENEFDIIHAHDWLTIPAALEAQKQINKPLVLHIHATEIDRTGGHVDQRIYDIERYGMECADTIIAVSHHTKKIIVEHYGIHPDKVVVVHNGIDYKSFKYAPVCDTTVERLTQLQNEGYQIVLFVGRLTVQKGVEYLIRAAQTIIARKPKTLFVIAGSGDLQHQLIQLTASLQISDNVIFAGWVDGPQRTSLYALADLFVMPSVSEPFGLVSLEAAVHNTPIILSKTSGASEILKHAFAVDYWDTHKTADMMYTILEYRSLRRLLAKRGKKAARRVSWGKTAQKISSLYEVTIAHHTATQSNNFAEETDEYNTLSSII